MTAKTKKSPPLQFCFVFKQNIIVFFLRFFLQMQTERTKFSLADVIWSRKRKISSIRDTVRQLQQSTKSKTKVQNPAKGQSTLLVFQTLKRIMSCLGAVSGEA